jgi:hypothetical protein
MNMMDRQNHINGNSSPVSSTPSSCISVLEIILQSNPSAAQSALAAPSVIALRVPCYCEENVWRLTFRKLYQQQQQQQQQQQNQLQQIASSNYTIVQYHVIFISNPKACVPMFQQLASSQRHQPIFWDYHVILVSTTTMTTTTTDANVTANAARITASLSLQPDQPQQSQQSSESHCCSSTCNNSDVWDMDSHLHCPCPFDQYMTSAFRDCQQWSSHYTPYFRVVDALTFLCHFSSDRSHMIQRDTGQWSAPPPSYPCIVPSPPPQQEQQPQNLSSKGGKTMTLPRYMRISEQEVSDATNAHTSTPKVKRTNNYECNSSSVFGRIYTLNELRKRFGSQSL